MTGGSISELIQLATWVGHKHRSTKTKGLLSIEFLSMLLKRNLILNLMTIDTFSGHGNELAFDIQL